MVTYMRSERFARGIQTTSCSGGGSDGVNEYYSMRSEINILVITRKRISSILNNS